MAIGLDLWLAVPCHRLFFRRFFALDGFSKPVAWHCLFVAAAAFEAVSFLGGVLHHRSQRVDCQPVALPAFSFFDKWGNLSAACHLAFDGDHFHVQHRDCLVQGHPGHGGRPAISDSYTFAEAWRRDGFSHRQRHHHGGLFVPDCLAISGFYWLEQMAFCGSSLADAGAALGSKIAGKIECAAFHSQVLSLHLGAVFFGVHLLCDGGIDELNEKPEAVS